MVWFYRYKYLSTIQQYTRENLARMSYSFSFWQHRLDRKKWTSQWCTLYIHSKNNFCCSVRHSLHKSFANEHFERVLARWSLDGQDGIQLTKYYPSMIPQSAQFSNTGHINISAKNVAKLFVCTLPQTITKHFNHTIK